MAVGTSHPLWHIFTISPELLIIYVELMQQLFLNLSTYELYLGPMFPNEILFTCSNPIFYSSILNFINLIINVLKDVQCLNYKRYIVMNKDQELCQQHSNKAQRLCLHPVCKQRLMCLLCEHQHGQFQSILVKTSEDYKKFKNILNEAIDNFLQKTQKTSQALIRAKQQNLVKDYFMYLKKGVNQLINNVLESNLKLLEGDDKEIIEQIQRVRIIGKYQEATSEIFDIFLQVYEGQKFQDFFKGQSQNKVQIVQQNIKNLHKSIQSIAEINKFKLSFSPPLITQLSVVEVAERGIPPTNYQTFQSKVALTNRLKHTSHIEFQSIISDSIISKDHILVTSYDKTLKVFDKELNYLSNIDHQNIITKLCQISQNIYALGISKELWIEKICQETNWQAKVIMKLKGHTQRINDIHWYNSRIIGSSSEEGTKIWDLYKEKCQHTFKSQSNPNSFRFLPTIKQIAIGYNDHTIRNYSIQNLKLIRKWKLEGLPLFISQQKLNENMFYVSGFPSNLYIIDIRVKKIALMENFKSQAISCFNQSIFSEYQMILGQRGGKARIFDLSSRRTRHEWSCHVGKTNISKPNGIVKAFCQSDGLFVTVGCNQRKVKIWQVIQSQ